MPAPTKTDNTPRTNGRTEEQMLNALAAIEERRKDPEYLERMGRIFAEAEEVRRRINEEDLRHLDSEKPK
jgi:hypothetical protein